MIDKIRSWLVRHRDQTSVSYARFGRPGEEEDDRPPPTAIYVAPFNENSPEFMVMQCYHVEKATAAFACFGMSVVILFFITSFFEFDWYHHEKGIDVAALLSLFGYLALGVLVHYYVLYGIKKQMAYYLLPFIVVYCILLTVEVIGCLTLLYAHYIAKSVDFKVLTPVHNYESTSAQPYFFALIILFIAVLIQLIMLLVVLRCRDYLSRKHLHQLELSVAEKSKTSNPSIRILIANDNNPPTTYEPSVQNPNHTMGENGTSTTVTSTSPRSTQEPSNGIPHDPVSNA